MERLCFVCPPRYVAMSCVSIALLSIAVAQQSALTQSASAGNSSEARAVIRLSNLVAKSDPLAQQNLSFDASFAQEAIDYIHSPSPKLLDSMVESLAITHILNHARNFDYDVPKDSRTALVNNLLGPQDKQAVRLATCQRALAYFSGPMLADPHWVSDSLRYLPADFRYNGALFLTFGYDIGVAFGANASLNCTHPRFDLRPRELLYYAIHELHHVGFMAYQPPPKLDDIKTCAELLKLVEYSTQLEGMAVLAAYQRRSEEHALADDPDSSLCKMRSGCGRTWKAISRITTIWPGAAMKLPTLMRGRLSPACLPVNACGTEWAHIWRSGSSQRRAVRL